MADPFKSKVNHKNFSRPEGAGNFDNMDDYNIVNHIDINTGTIQHTPANDKDIVNKEFSDGEYLKLDASNDPITGDLTIEKANPIFEMKLTGEIQDASLVFSEEDGTTGGFFRYNGKGLFTDPKSFIFATFQTGGKIKFSSGGNLLVLTLDENQNATFTGDLNVTDNLTISDTGKIIFSPNATPYDDVAFMGIGNGFDETIIGIRHDRNILNHSVANGYAGFPANIGGIIEIWNNGGAAYPLAIRQDGVDSAIVVKMNPTFSGDRNANLIGLDFVMSTNSQPNFNVQEDQYIWGGIRANVEYSGSMTFLRHNFYGGWFKSISNNANVTAVGFRAIAENTVDSLNARAIIADGAVDINGDLTFIGSGKGLVYGTLSVVSNANPTIITTQNVYVQVRSFDTDGVSNNTTPDHNQDHITILKDGDYEIMCPITANSIAGAGATFEYEVKKNNGTSRIGSAHGDRTLAGGGSEAGSITIGTIAALEVNDTVELWVKNETNTQNIITEDATLIVKQVGG